MLKQGSCITLLGKVPDESVDLIITSPPYGLDKEYEEPTTLADYCNFISLWIEQIPRVLTPTGQFWLNVGAGKFKVPLTYIYHKYIKLNFMQEIVWQFSSGLPTQRKFSPRTERWMWYCKGSDYTFNLDPIRVRSEYADDPRYNPAGKNPSDIWYFHQVTSTGPGRAEKTDHPCQFPQSMIQRIVEACSNKDDMILDPFAGSGTVGVVAKLLKRKYQLFEIDPIYCGIAEERIKSANIFTLIE